MGKKIDFNSPSMNNSPPKSKNIETRVYDKGSMARYTSCSDGRRSINGINENSLIEGCVFNGVSLMEEEKQDPQFITPDKSRAQRDHDLLAKQLLRSLEKKKNR
eukprot:TRINITY_DN12923_c0_g1_i1.p1 TRINITY_DN12923_c0_g1~~TRINITY_DN12923_c0_g1_i1.p1  ORF type:complete len:104 (+),score=2.55 TRINITY_DN12923_c0_g1_i1:2-313(+)